MWSLELPDWSYLDSFPLPLSICHWIWWKNKPVSDNCRVIASRSVEISDLFDKNRLSVTSEVLPRAGGFWFLLLWLWSRGVCEGLWSQRTGNSVGTLLWVTYDVPEHLHSQRVFSSSQSCWIVQSAFRVIFSFFYPFSTNPVLILWWVWILCELDRLQLCVPRHCNRFGPRKLPWLLLVRPVLWLCVEYRFAT